MLDRSALLQRLRRSWFFAIGPAIVLVAGLAVRSDFLTDWDSFGYAFIATQARSSSLMLGRWWFVLVMWIAWLLGGAAGLPPLEVHVAMQLVNLVFSCAAVVGVTAWIGRLTGDRRTAALGGLLFAVGPLIWIYSTAVMTEAMALATLAWSLYAWQRAIGQEGSGRRSALAWALLAGALFGVAVDVREPLATLALWPILSCRIYRSKVRFGLLAAAAAAAGVTLGFGILMGWAWCWREGHGYFHNVAGWSRWMGWERNEYPIHVLSNLAFVVGHVALTVPLALATLAAAGFVAARRALRRRAPREPAPSTSDATGPARAIALSSIGYVLLLLTDHSLPANPRHAMALGVMLVPLAATLARRFLGPEPWLGGARATMTRSRKIALGVGLAVVVSVSIPSIIVYEKMSSALVAVRDAVLAAPPRSLVIPGTGTPVARYLVRIGARPDILIIESGWTFPHDELLGRIGSALSEGRPVFVNDRREAWQWGTRPSREWESVQDALRSCERLPTSRAMAPFVRIRLREDAPARDPTGR